MSIIGKLPMNPWLFIVLIILLSAAGAIIIGLNMNMGWWGLINAAALSLQLTWVFQAGMYAFGKADRKLVANEKRAKQQRLVIGALVSVAITFSTVFLGFLFFADPESGAITGPAALPFVLAVLLGAASFFTFIFQVAKILCQVEEKETGERIFVTCLLLFYLVIGAPFLFRRLKQLGAA